MNWQSAARRNGRALANSKFLSTGRFNGLYSKCGRRVQASLSVLQQSLVYPPSIRYASVQSTIPQQEEYAKKNPGSQKNALEPVPLMLSAELLSVMSDALDAVLKQPSLPPIAESNDGKKRNHDQKRLKWTEKQKKKRSVLLQRHHEKNKTDDKLESIRAIKESLPINQCRAEILNMIKGNVFSIIVGATGSGKSTQVPQIILEDEIERGNGSSVNIICTQPRRIAAASIAHRVAAERNEELSQTVGYFMRFENKIADVSGSIQYCTIGALFQKLHTNPAYLDGLSHIVLDEVHERSTEIDMAMLLLKQTIDQRIKDKQNVPRIVIMSATLDEDLFKGYFERVDHRTGNIIPCPVVHVPGRTFPVTKLFLNGVLSEIKERFTKQDVLFLTSDKACRKYVLKEQRFGVEEIANPETENPEAENHENEKPENGEPETEKPETPDKTGESPVPIKLVVSTIASIAKTSKTNGGILVFLPGWGEIADVQWALGKSPFGIDFNDASKYKVYAVHSEHLEAQAAVLAPEAEGVTKIILATNIAEASITIPDVEYVVDCGKQRESFYNQEDGTSELNTTWISKSSANQRAGRAGRTKSGKYFALLSESRYNALGKATPDILRGDLQKTCLDIKSRYPGIPIKDALAAAIEPPNPEILNNAINSLRDIDALDHDEELTVLGTLLSSMPLHPFVGRMIILGIVFRCLDPMLMLAASTSTKRLFVKPLGYEKEANAAHRRFDGGYNSDSVRLVTAFREARDRKCQGLSGYAKFMRDSYMSTKSFDNIQQVMVQIKFILDNEGLLPRRFSPQARGIDLNENSDNFSLIRALSIVVYRGNIARRDRREKGGCFLTRTGDKAVVAKSSPNNPRFVVEGALDMPEEAIVSYGQMARMDDGNYTLRETTLISPVAAALFTPKLEIDPQGSLLTLNNWLQLRVQGGPGLPAGEDISTTILLFREAWDQILTSAFASLSSGKQATNYRQQQAFVDALVAVVSRDFGDEDVRRVVDGIGIENRRQEKSQARAARDEADAVKIDRLKSHLSQNYGD